MWLRIVQKGRVLENKKTMKKREDSKKLLKDKQKTILKMKRSMKACKNPILESNVR